MARIPERTATTDVQIFGQAITLLSTEDEVYARDVAAFVDRKMSEIAAAHNVADTGKVAIMAAMEIADCIVRGRRDREEGLQRTKAAADRLGRCVDGSTGGRT